MSTRSAVRVLRAIGLIRADAGDHNGARIAFEAALELVPDGFERALTLRAMARVLPDPSADRSSEADEILTRLEVRCPPPLTAADLRRDPQRSNVTSTLCPPPGALLMTTEPLPSGPSNENTASRPATNWSSVTS